MASGASYLTGKNLLRRAKRGLYAGRMILFGNQISEDGGNRCACRCCFGIVAAVAINAHLPRTDVTDTGSQIIFVAETPNIMDLQVTPAVAAKCAQDDNVQRCAGPPDIPALYGACAEVTIRNLNRHSRHACTASSPVILTRVTWH